MAPAHPIARKFDALLAAEIASGGMEPEIVKRYVAAVGSLPHAAGCKIQTAFIHQKPYALFVDPPRLSGRKKCELGDILYVFKTKTGGVVRLAQAAFMQVKVGDPAKSWAIEPHQLEFLTGIRKHHFRFGNSVFQAAGVKPMVYSGLMHSGDFGYYLLIGGPERLCYEADKVLAAVGAPKAGAKIGIRNPICCSVGKAFCDCDSHGALLDRAFAGGPFGAAASGQLAGMLDIIYKRLGVVPDPPEEYEGYFFDEGGGFGLIEVTVDADEVFRETPSE